MIRLCAEEIPIYEMKDPNFLCASRTGEDSEYNAGLKKINKNLVLEYLSERMVL